MTRFVLAAIALLGATGCFKLDGFLYEPERTEQYLLDPKSQYAEETVTADRVEHLTIQTPDQLTLHAVYVKGNIQPPRAYVIFFHGKADHLDGQWWRAKRWSNLGFDVLAFDYRGWGMSTDVIPTEEGIAVDTQAVQDWMVSRLGAANAARIIYYGHSLGTATATPQAIKTPPRALVLESGFASIEEFKRDSTQMDFPYGFYAQDSWDTVGRIADVQVPVLIIHGLLDDFVRPEFSEQIYAHANEPKRLELVPGGHHSDVPRVMGAAYGALVSEFVNRALER